MKKQSAKKMSLSSEMIVVREMPRQPAKSRSPKRVASGGNANGDLDRNNSDS